ncbi:hypothetical protein Vadar_019498 [Vaccinium darrowii]|uniref:Uncharacterized protein n=1 Tax=Vaccinium darrowii TaxID=229202 RepID=A0ACB7ZCN3_9ERIC|nr:hypothetical protein Vadar_019498 [Vaccinium darrowii]
MLIEAGNIYTKVIFEEFQDQYVQALELCIESKEFEADCMFYTFEGHSSQRRLRRDRDGNVSCWCRLFEMRGILCSHAIKVLKDEMNIMEIPSQYILKRWTRGARAQVVQDSHGREIQADPKLEKSNRYRSLCSLFITIACRASELQAAYDVSIQDGRNLLKVVEDMLASQISGLQLRKECVVVNDGRDKECVVVNENIIKAKEIKKKPVTCRRKRRIKSSLEKAMASARKRKQSQSHEGLQMPPNMLSYLLSECGPGVEALLQGGTSNSSMGQCSNSLIAGTSNAEQFGYMPSANHFGQW